MTSLAAHPTTTDIIWGAVERAWGRNGEIDFSPRPRLNKNHIQASMFARPRGRRGSSIPILQVRECEMSQYIEFEVDDAARFAELRRIFDEIKRDKESEEFRPDEDWLKLFDDEALSHFSVPTPQERQEWLDLRESTPIAITPIEQTSGLRWDLLSMIDAFFDGEYELLNCAMTGDNRARLEFYAFAYPYGGVGCMVALIEAFDFRVIGINDGTGYVKVS